MRKGPHPLYRTETVLDGPQLSKRQLVIYGTYITEYN